MNERLQTVLIFLIKEGQVLLAQKAKGHGPGKWNGAGGIMQPNETPNAAARRKAREELGVSIMNITEAATLRFEQTPYVDQHSESDVTVFLCDEWQGEPSESDELQNLTWFTYDDVPYNDMWADDRLWLPQVLSGDRILGRFTFNDKNEVISHSLTPHDAIPPTLDLEEQVAEQLAKPTDNTPRIDG